MNILPTPATAAPLSPRVTPPAEPAGTPHISVLADDGNTKIQQISTYKTDPQGKRVPDVSRVLITTSDRADNVSITVGANHQLNARINGKDYKLPLTANNNAHSLRINTAGGNDRITVDKYVNIEMHINSGDGDDDIVSNGRVGTVIGGKGNDHIRLGTGDMAVTGGDGDDTITAGTGNAAISEGKGNDHLYTGFGPANRVLFLNGDRGDDHLYAGPGKVVLNGGRGNDTLSGYYRTTFYSGEGADTINSYDKNDKIYAKSTDTINNQGNSKIIPVTYSESGRKGLVIKGTEQFIEQTEDVIDRLRASPAGQKALEAMDQFVEDGHRPIVLTESHTPGFSAYGFRNEYTSNAELRKDPFRPEFGYIKDNKPGSVSTQPEIVFEPADFDQTFSISPEITLHHELAHAFNGATGTGIPGKQILKDANGAPLLRGGVPRTVNNEEYQVVGIPTDATPFDFDNNPNTPATNVNPYPFTENALREEMGVPLRDRYDVDEAPRI